MRSKAKRLARHWGHIMRRWRNCTATCPCHRRNRKEFKIYGNRLARTQVKYRDLAA